jgi:hypothetical protein
MISGSQNPAKAIPSHVAFFVNNLLTLARIP